MIVCVYLARALVPTTIAVYHDSTCPSAPRPSVRENHGTAAPPGIVIPIEHIFESPGRLRGLRQRLQQTPRPFQAARSSRHRHRHRHPSFSSSTRICASQSSSIIGRRRGSEKSYFAQLETCLAELLRLSVGAGHSPLCTASSPTLKASVHPVDAPKTTVYLLPSVSTIRSFAGERHVDEFSQRKAPTWNGLHKVLDFDRARHRRCLTWDSFYLLGTLFGPFCKGLNLVRDAGRRFIACYMLWSPCTESRADESRDGAQGSTLYVSMPDQCRRNYREPVLRASFCSFRRIYRFHACLHLLSASHPSFLRFVSDEFFFRLSLFHAPSAL